MSARGISEALVFGAIALGLHVAFWLKSPAEGVLDAAGSGGNNLVSLQAVSTEVAAQLDAIDNAPEIPDAPEPPAEMQPPARQQAMLAPPPADVPRAEQPVLPSVSGPGMALPTLSAPPDLPEPPEPPEPETTQTEPETPEDPPQEANPVVPDAFVSDSPLPPRRPEGLKRPEPPKQQTQAASRPKPEEPVNSNRNSDGQAAARAAGSGGGSVAGNNGSNDRPSMSSAQRANLMNTWGARISQRIQRKTARVRNASGTATVTIKVSSDGRLAGVGILRSSGNAEVDKAATDAVRRAGRFPKAPRGVNPGTYQFNVPIQIRS